MVEQREELADVAGVVLVAVLHHVGGVDHDHAELSRLAAGKELVAYLGEPARLPAKRPDGKPIAHLGCVRALLAGNGRNAPLQRARVGFQVDVEHPALGASEAHPVAAGRQRHRKRDQPPRLVRLGRPSQKHLVAFQQDALDNLVGHGRQLVGHHDRALEPRQRGSCRNFPGTGGGRLDGGPHFAQVSFLHGAHQRHLVRYNGPKPASMLPWYSSKSHSRPRIIASRSLASLHPFG